MYIIVAAYDKDTIGAVPTPDGKPIVFETEEEAWDIVQKIMQQSEHPRVMSVAEVDVCESSTT